MSAQSPIDQYDHFIPISTHRLIQQLTMPGLDKHQLGVIQLIKQILSFEFNLKQQQLKTLYQAQNPDNELSDNANPELDSSDCTQSIRELLVNANFSELDQQQIQYALEKTSPYGLKIEIDFTAFAEVALFYRGKASKQIQIRDWKRLYMKKKSHNLISYRRLFLLLKYKDQQHKPGLHLKLFKDILRPDLEMLFPECRVRIKLLDKLKLILTGGGGTAGGLFATIGKISAAVSPWTIVIAVGGLIMLIWRQISKIFVQKTRYMMTLAQNLYFHNMDNNMGAITYLIDLARQEEIKETILAYALLSMHQVHNINQLDDLCEQWFLENFDIQIDFDVSDAVEKLRRLKLIDEADESLTCKPALESKNQLQLRWMDFISETP